MGYAKEQLLAAQERHDIIVGIALEAGALEPCPVHSDISVRGRGNDSKAYAFLTNAFKRGEVPYDDLQSAREAMKHILDEHELAEGCGYCRKNFEKD